MKDIIHIKARKSDGTVYRWWDAEIEEKSDTHLIARQRSGETVFEPENSWVSGINIRFYYWKDRHYNLMEIYSDTGEPLELYVNIASPMELKGRELSYYDYELDVIKKIDGEAILVDEDEFSQAIKDFKYSQDFIQACYKSAEDAIDLVNRWSWKDWN